MATIAQYLPWPVTLVDRGASLGVAGRDRQLPLLLSDQQAIAVGIRIDLHDDLLDGGARRAASADRFHCDETGRFELRQGTRQIGLRPAGHLHQLGDRLRLAVADHCEQLAVLRRQQPHHRLNGVEAGPARISRRRPLAARDCSHFLFESIQAHNSQSLHGLLFSSTLTTVSAIPRQELKAMVCIAISHIISGHDIHRVAGLAARSCRAFAGEPAPDGC